eukprot:NODE_359_length_10180_cov_0.431703.p1 type:complete len:648 gc:universal NODE_359_length_10180_cov_0.431703:8558-6615(-)
MKIEDTQLFEVSHEVANKVGGIYTVIRTKAATTSAYYPGKYIMLGMLNQKHASVEVEPVDASLLGPFIKESLEVLKNEGLNVLTGRWLIEGSPYVILFDLGSLWYKLPEWKKELWEVCKVPSYDEDTEQNNATVFGFVVAWFVSEYVSRQKSNPVVVHAHEWLGGVCLPLIRSWNLNIATIFTTHATLLGRYLCAGETDFYNNLKSFDVDKEAGQRQIYHRYCIERGAAHNADVFTTVSHITAYEAESLLKRKPDGVTPNGLNVTKFAAVHEFQNLHAQAKEKISNFVRGHFYGHLDFDLDNTLYFFTAGRYEYRNKGIDMYLESLARLNWRLKESKSKMTVVAFIITHASNQSYTVDSMKGQAVVKQLQATVEDVQQKIGKRLYEMCLKGIQPTVDLLTKEEKIQLKRRVLALKRDLPPAVVTHNMTDSSDDPVLQDIRRLQLFNSSHDRVKIVFHPEFLSANSPLFPIEYEEFVRGCHLGVFPSYYEPWGYTPAECTVLGVPSITTNLSGFGCYMDEIIKDTHEYGIFIVDRRMKSVDESIEEIVKHMMHFCKLSRRERIQLRNRTERLSDLLDWKVLGIEYQKARRLALKRHYGLTIPDDALPNIGKSVSPALSRIQSTTNLGKLKLNEERADDIVVNYKWQQE